MAAFCVCVIGIKSRRQDWHMRTKTAWRGGGGAKEGRPNKTAEIGEYDCLTPV